MSAKLVECAQVVRTFLFNNNKLSIVIILDYIIDSDNIQSYFDQQLSNYLFNLIQEYYSCDTLIKVIYRILNKCTISLSSSKVLIPFTICTKTLLSKQFFIKKLKSALLFDKSLNIRISAAKLFLNINNTLLNVNAIGDDHLRRIWIENMIINDIIYLLKSLLYLQKYYNDNHQCIEYMNIIQKIDNCIMQISNQKQKDKIQNLKIKELNVTGTKNIDNDNNDKFDFKYLDSFKNILIVGDGDFSFTLSLIHYLDKNNYNNKHIITSCYPNIWKMCSVYCDLGFIINNIEQIYKGKCDISFDVDATKIHLLYQYDDIDCIIWNLPQTETESYDIDANKRLIKSFLISCDKLFSQNLDTNSNKALFLSLHCNTFNKKKETRHRWKKRNQTLSLDKLIDQNEERNQFDTWNVEEIVQTLHLKLHKVYQFDVHKFDQYRVLNHLTGSQFKGFKQAFTYLFFHSCTT